jgi:hypothetical protein
MSAAPGSPPGAAFFQEGTSHFPLKWISQIATFGRCETVLGYLRGASPEEINDSSNRVYAWVASQVGTTPSKERFPNTSPRRNGSKENEPTSRKR